MSRETSTVAAAVPRPSGVARRQRALARRTAGAVIVRGSGVLSGYATQVALARILGAEAFGAYSYAVNLAQLMATPCDLGSANAAVRFIPQYVANFDANALGGFLRAIDVVPLVLSCLVAGAGAAVVASVGGGPISRDLGLIAMALVPLMMLLSLYSGVTQGFHRVVAANFAPLVLQPVVLAAAMVGFFVVDGHVGTDRAITLTAVSFAVGIFVQFGFSARGRRTTHGRLRRYAAREWLSVSLPLLLTNIVQLVLQRVDVLMVGVLISTKAVGVYTVAFRTASLTFMLQSAMNTVITPRLAQLYWSGRKDELEDSLLAAVRLVLVPTVVLTVVLIALGRPILGTFGRSFRAGWAPMSIYACGQLVSVAAGPVGWFLNVTGSHRVAASINLTTAVLAFVGYLVLIPPFGLVGAATANAFAVALNNVWQLLVIRRRYGYRISPWRALVRRRRQVDIA